MGQTASVADCPAPLLPGLHPTPLFSADSLQLPRVTQAVTATSEAELSPELSQASKDSLETQIACLQVCTEADTAAQAHVRSPELPIAPVQAKSAFAPGSDSSRAAHQEEESCQSPEPWQDVDGNAWAVDQSGSFSIAAQTDQAMLSDVPQQDSSSWDYYEIYKQQQLLDQLEYDDSWQDEDSCEDADYNDIIFSHQQPHVYDDSWQDDDRYSQRQLDSSCQRNQGQAKGFDTTQAPYFGYSYRQRQHGGKEDGHELVHDNFPHSVQTDRSARYQPHFDNGFQAAQQFGRADSNMKRKGQSGGIPAALRKAGSSRGQLSATDDLTDRPMYRPTDRPAKLVAPKQHPSHSKHLQPGHNANAEEHAIAEEHASAEKYAMHSKLRQLGVQLSGQRPTANQKFQQQHAHYFKVPSPALPPTANHRNKQCFPSSKHQQGAAGAFSDHHRSSDDHYSDRHRLLDQHDQHVGAGVVSCLGTSMPQNDRQSASFVANSTEQGKVLTAYRHKASSSMHGLELPCTEAVSRPGNMQASSLSQPQITADAGNAQPLH